MPLIWCYNVLLSAKAIFFTLMSLQVLYSACIALGYPTEGVLYMGVCALAV